MQEMPLTWQWEHIRGHQDEAKLEKSHKAHWNAAMDTAAKKNWDKIQNHPGPTVLTFSGEPWQLWLGNAKG